MEEEIVIVLAMHVAILVCFGDSASFESQ